jgi:hypothetical protein
VWNAELQMLAQRPGLPLDGGAPLGRREIVNGILYVVRGNQWRAMPHDLPLRAWESTLASNRRC